MKIYLATWVGEKIQGVELTNMKYKNRLVSYYFLLEQKITPKELVTYCKTGDYEDRQK